MILHKHRTQMHEWQATQFFRGGGGVRCAFIIRAAAKDHLGHAVTQTDKQTADSSLIYHGTPAFWTLELPASASRIMMTGHGDWTTRTDCARPNLSSSQVWASSSSFALIHCYLIVTLSSLARKSAACPWGAGKAD
jgi:hypothetical protein